jgi:hypothetical protein
MSTQEANLKFDGDRVLLPVSLGFLVCSAVLPLLVLCRPGISALSHHSVVWLYPIGLLATIGLLFSPAWLLLSCWEVRRYQHGWRCVLSVLISLLACVTGWATFILHNAGKL